VRKKLAADERQEKKRRPKNESAREQCALGMIEAPLESAGIAVADPFEDAVSFFLYTFF